LHQKVNSHEKKETKIKLTIRLKLINMEAKIDKGASYAKNNRVTMAFH
jgi:hypothetical protein